MTAIHKAEDYPQSFDEHVARLPEVTYADTAFKGDFDESPSRHSTWWVKDIFQENTKCHEYIALKQAYEVGELGEWKKKYSNLWSKGEANYNQRQYRNHGTDLPTSYHFWGFEFTLIGWFEFVRFLAIVGTYVAIGSPIMGLILVGFFWPMALINNPTLLTIHFIPPILLFVTNYLIKTGVPSRISSTPKPTISFHRDTGMVTIRRRMKTTSLPFREIQGAAFTTYDPHSKLKKLSFGIKHKHSSSWATMEGNLTASTPMERWRLNLRWEILVHFMDVTRPLPDIPMFEPFRHLDPTTRSWDKEHKRPETVWLDMPEEEYEILFEAALKSAEDYPLQSPYEKSGDQKQWKPAGDGEHWYQLG